MENYIIEENGIYLKDENGKVLAEIEFEKISNDTYNIYHTFVDDSLRGKGIAAKLVEAAYDEIVIKRKCKVKSTCSYASHWLEKNKK